MSHVHQPELVPRSTDARLAQIATERLQRVREDRDALERSLEDRYAVHDREVWYHGESEACHCEAELLEKLRELDTEALRLERTIRGLRR